MKVLRGLQRKINSLVYHYRYWKIEYQLWSVRPKMFSAVALIGLIALCMTAFDIGAEGVAMRDEVAIQRSIANAFDEAPGIWLKQLEAKKETISEYQYELQKAQYEFFTARAPSIAERIRDDAFWNVLKKSLTMAGKQSAQVAAGKIAGKAADMVGTRIGYKATEAGAKLVEKGYSRVGRYIGSKGDTLIWGAEKLGDTFANLAWEVTEAATRDEKWKTPILQKAMKAPEFAELFQLIQKATERKPDKLMGAHLYQYIKMAGNAKHRPADEYRTSVMITAQNLNKLTKEGGSSDSMWDNAEELAKWIANKIGRPLPEEPSSDEPEPEPASLANFTAHGEFTRYKDMEEWTKNEIIITVENWVVSGTGVLVNEVKTSALHRYSKNNFAFSGKFYNAPEEASALGYFKNTLVIHNSEQYSSVTGDNGTHEKRFSWEGTLREGGIIEGTLNDWPVDFKLVIE